MRAFQDAYEAKLAYLKEELGPEYTTVPRVSKILHIDPGRLRADPTFPAVPFGKRSRVPIDSLARWLVDMEFKQRRGR